MSWQTLTLPPTFNAASFNTAFTAAPGNTNSAAAAPQTDATQAKKRVIPNHLVVRSQRKVNDAALKLSLNGESAGYNTSLSFGAGRNLHSPAFTSNQEGTDDDAPPMKSIYDLREEDETKDDSALLNSFVHKDPKEFNNVFNKTRNSLNVGAKPETAVLAPMANGESAVLVFGYPESIANEVISHFNQYGLIMEDFAIVRNRNNSAFTPSKGRSPASAPIFSGEGWVKLTYDNPSSAMRALEDNGIYYNGSLVGVVQYTKAAVEKLTNRKISNKEDVGETRLPVVQTVKPDEKAVESLFNLSLELKDGRSLFFNETDASKKAQISKVEGEKTSVLGKLGKLVFGFDAI
ncbi:hypothetical protein BABINDRAFT_160949 [Babjeviella inositovora NRRL Y-12698]|uniref:RRM Nup35-type domain-containing protein n=1 Tax=Babjeviella inositovora NRRL Y-12698 TaxID=984486 RepID=A0A1E3QUU8_9ASCO|nr:uncharacterized protein BABINDRAFT_160949 [Babjeviella inositovora NRRL Y-12698]ODQ80727.1 hypothetical protein BABINDRAFT_160949 [Babjeviella inositovora NRRL Y-12698]